MSKKEKQKRTKKGLTTANLLSILAVFVLIPLLMGMILPKNLGKPPDNDELEENDSLENSTEKEDLTKEGLAVDLTGFKDYQFPVKRTQDFTKEDHNVSSTYLNGGVSLYELTDGNDNKFLEFGSVLNNDNSTSYVNYNNLSKEHTTHSCDGVVISFDVAMDNIKALDKFQLILRDENNEPLGSNIPYNKIDIPNIFGTWQHIVLYYSFPSNVCTVYINGEKTVYQNVFTGYVDTSSYTIFSFRAIYSYEYKYCRTFIDNFNMEYYTGACSEEIINSFETRAGEILDLPIAYVDGVAYYNFKHFKECLTGKDVKDVVIISPYVYDETETITISCPVRIKNYGPMKLEFSSNLECIGELEGVYFYDFVKEK